MGFVQRQELRLRKKKGLDGQTRRRGRLQSLASYRPLRVIGRRTPVMCSTFN